MGLFNFYPFNNSKHYFSNEPYFSSNFLTSLNFLSSFSLPPCLNLVKNLSFSLSFLRILYSKVFIFPKDDTFHQTSFSYQFSGIGIVACKYLSDTNSQKTLGFSITKYTTLPYSSAKMEEVATSLNKANIAFPN